MADQSIIVRHASAVTTGGTSVDFGTGVQRIYIACYTQDVLIEPNGPANADSFRVPTGIQPIEFNFSGSNVRTLGLKSQTATSDVYLIGVVT